MRRAALLLTLIALSAPAAGAARSEDDALRLRMSSHGQSAMGVAIPSYCWSTPPGSDGDPGTNHCVDGYVTGLGRPLPVHGGSVLALRPGSDPERVSVDLNRGAFGGSRQPADGRIGRTLTARPIDRGRRAWRVKLPSVVRGAGYLSIAVTYQEGTITFLVAVRPHAHAGD